MVCSWLEHTASKWRPCCSPHDMTRPLHAPSRTVAPSRHATSSSMTPLPIPCCSPTWHAAHLHAILPRQYTLCASCIYVLFTLLNSAMLLPPFHLCLISRIRTQHPRWCCIGILPCMLWPFPSARSLLHTCPLIVCTVTMDHSLMPALQLHQCNFSYALAS